MGMTVRTALQQGTKLLEEGSVAAPRLTAEVLLCHALGHETTFLYSHGEDELPEVAWIHFGRYLYQRLEGKPKKEKLVQSLLRQCPQEEGLVTVLQVMETCRTVKLRHGQGRPRLAFARRPQRVLYYYFLDPEFGLMYVRVQTWFPFTIQVYVNGHDWLARQMQRRRLGFSA